MMYKVTNVTDTRIKRGTTEVVPRRFHGPNNLRLEPGQHVFLGAIPWEMQIIINDPVHGVLDAIEWDLEKGEAARAVEPEPAPQPEQEAPPELSPSSPPSRPNDEAEEDQG